MMLREKFYLGCQHRTKKFVRKLKMAEIKKPKEGKKVDQEKLDIIVAEKIDEWKKTQQQRGDRAGGGR